MYNPVFRFDSKNIPLLNKKDINIIAENYAMDYMPEIFSHPGKFNIDGFAEQYLKLTLDYQFLSNDGRNLGMTVFNTTNKVIIYNPEKNEADYSIAKAGTIIIDNRLVETQQTPRYLFTLGHEVGHWIFHQTHFDYHPNQEMLPNTNTPFVICHEKSEEMVNKPPKNTDTFHWIEWQANCFAAAILMPERSVRLLIETEAACRDTFYLTNLIADTFIVSKQAAQFRLIELRLTANNKCSYQPTLF